MSERIRDRELKDREFRCWKCDGHGDVPTEEAKEILENMQKQAGLYGTAHLDLEMKKCPRCGGRKKLDINDMTQEDWQNIG